MKNILKNFILTMFIFIFWLIWIFQVSARSIILPDWDWQEDINIDNPQVSTNETGFFEYIQIINYYLRFSIAWIAMAVLIFSGIQMIIAWWDKSKVSKAGKMAISCLIAIVVAMLSYLLVKLIIWLF